MLSQTSILLGASGNSKRVINMAYSASSNAGKVLKTDVMSGFGWDGTTAIILNLTIDSGVVLGSPSTSDYALKIQNFPADTEINITNNGTIVGKGGAGGSGGSATFDGANGGGSGGNGGPALFTDQNISIDNLNGKIWGGGGGGGGGAGSKSQVPDGEGTSTTVGGGGGGGGGAGASNSNGGSGGTATGGDFNFPGNSGGGGSLNSGGDGGTSSNGGKGGGGGGPGAAGSSGITIESISGGSNGSAGIYAQGNSKITWINVGNVKGGTAG